jgi:hypothetical protein
LVLALPHGSDLLEHYKDSTAHVTSDWSEHAESIGWQFHFVALNFLRHFDWITGDYKELRAEICNLFTIQQ